MERAQAPDEVAAVDADDLAIAEELLQRAELWQQELRQLLDPAGRGGSAARSLSSALSDDTGT